jgi:hypothetical protein
VKESPGVFSSKRYPAVLRRAQRTAVNVTLSRLQLHLPAAPAPPVHRGVTERSQILRWQGELLCFQFTVRLNLQRLTCLIYFVADRARKAGRKLWMHFSPYTKHHGICRSCRSWMLRSGPGHGNGCVTSIGPQNWATVQQPGAGFPSKYRLELSSLGSVSSCRGQALAWSCQLIKVRPLPEVPSNLADSYCPCLLLLLRDFWPSLVFISQS